MKRFLLVLVLAVAMGVPSAYARTNHPWAEYWTYDALEQVQGGYARSPGVVQPFGWPQNNVDRYIPASSTFFGFDSGRKEAQWFAGRFMDVNTASNGTGQSPSIATSQTAGWPYQDSFRSADCTAFAYLFTGALSQSVNVNAARSAMEIAQAAKDPNMLAAWSIAHHNSSLQVKGMPGGGTPSNLSTSGLGSPSWSVVYAARRSGTNAWTNYSWTTFTVNGVSQTFTKQYSYTSATAQQPPWVIADTTTVFAPRNYLGDPLDNASSYSQGWYVSGSGYGGSTTYPPIVDAIIQANGGTVPAPPASSLPTASLESSVPTSSLLTTISLSDVPGMPEWAETWFNDKLIGPINNLTQAMSGWLWPIRLMDDSLNGAPISEVR